MRTTLVEQSGPPDYSDSVHTKIYENSDIERTIKVSKLSLVDGWSSTAAPATWGPEQAGSDRIVSLEPPTEPTPSRTTQCTRWLSVK